MTTEPIIESDMTFGPYQPGQCFYIEKSASYSAIQKHVPMAEYIVLRTRAQKTSMWIVEAKTASPINFDKYLDEIREKFINAFSLGWASCLRRHAQAEAELPDGFKTINLSTVRVKFVLVIKTCQQAWLPPLQEALTVKLRSAVKTWALDPTSVAVLNESLAQKYGLILARENTQHA